MTPTLAVVLGVFLAQTGAAVAPVFTGHGAAGYNRWLNQRSAEYSGLQPIHVQIDSGVALDSARYSYYVSFLDDTGAVVRQLTLAGVRETMATDGRWRWMHARVSGEGDVLYVCPEVGLTTVYGASGDSSFTAAEGVIDGGAGLYFREFVAADGVINRGFIEVLDGDGRSSDTVKGLFEPRVQAHVWSLDSTHVLYASDSAARAVVLDKCGRELWQYRLKSETDGHVAISADAQFVAVATWDSLVIRNMRTADKLSRPLRSGGRGKFVRPKVAISRDCRYVAVTRFHASVHDSVMLDIFTCDGKELCTSRVLRAGMVMGLGFVDDAVCIIARAYESPDGPTPGQSWKEPYRLMLVGLDGEVRTSDPVGPPHPHPPFKLVDDALAFFGEDSIRVYRIGSGMTDDRRLHGALSR